ncbi:hypothetical protein M3172_21260 [Mesobacillus subterraneus]|uniref:FtsX-like permease family protein n=1 Tax=Mesobacillus subterraneus TaxID=285983 RepID=UPI00203E5608|nr:FtsX-like permease family protein [Mesobacillus subterraneus]MCM3575725.1 hypothetical protein [Mesobacillus subterraneus]
MTFYKASEKDAVNNNPYDVAFLQSETKNTISVAELEVTFELKEHLEIPIFNYYEKLIYIDGYQTYQFMALEDFNKLTSQRPNLKDNQFLFYLNSEPEYAHTDIAESIKLSIQGEEKTFTMKNKVIERNINLLPKTYEFIVVGSDVLEALRQSPDGYELKLQLMNVADWRVSEKSVEQLKRQFLAGNRETSPMDYPDMPYTAEEDLFRVASKIGDYQTNQTTNGIMFYVTSFLSIMFFFGTFVLLYLNLFSEMDTEKMKYQKLNKIGMSSNEIKQNVTRELATIFFVPTILGTTLAFLYLAILSSDVGGIMKNPDILMHFLQIVGIYVMSQLVSFFYARKKMLFQLIN